MTKHQPSTQYEAPKAPRLTADDLYLLRSLPISIVAAAAAVEVADGRCTMSEILAGIRGIIDGAESFPENALISAVFEAYKADGAGEAELLAVCESPPDLVPTALALSRQATARLSGNADYWQGFAHWLLNLAVGVVEASAAGGLLGIGGERVTQVESRFLMDLAAALGSPAE